MSLTEKLNNEAESPLPWDEKTNLDLFKYIRAAKIFPKKGKIRMLDIGSADEGSYFVNRYGKEFPDTKIIYLDNKSFFLKELKHQNKVLANAIQMPFLDESFNITYAGYIIPYGILKDDYLFGNKSYLIAKEAYRVLKPEGLFLFTYGFGDDSQTLKNLSEIGFKRLEHLQRLNALSSSNFFIDTYIAIK